MAKEEESKVAEPTTSVEIASNAAAEKPVPALYRNVRIVLDDILSSIARAGADMRSSKNDDSNIRYRLIYQQVGAELPAAHQGRQVEEVDTLVHNDIQVHGVRSPQPMQEPDDNGVSTMPADPDVSMRQGVDIEGNKLPTAPEAYRAVDGLKQPKINEIFSVRSKMAPIREKRTCMFLSCALVLVLSGHFFIFISIFFSQQLCPAPA